MHAGLGIPEGAVYDVTEGCVTPELDLVRGIHTLIRSPITISSRPRQYRAKGSPARELLCAPKPQQNPMGFVLPDGTGIYRTPMLVGWPTSCFAARRSLIGVLRYHIGKPERKVTVYVHGMICMGDRGTNGPSWHEPSGDEMSGVCPDRIPRSIDPSPIGYWWPRVSPRLTVVSSRSTG
jgi:hypothetical protein